MTLAAVGSVWTVEEIHSSSSFPGEKAVCQNSVKQGLFPEILRLSQIHTFSGFHMLLNKKFLPGFFSLGLLALPVTGNVIVHISGVATYGETLSPSSSITVEGGEASFTSVIPSNSLVSVTGGEADFFGDIQNNVVFNLTGGVTTIDTLMNNAELNVVGGQLILVQAVGSGATVKLGESGVLQLDGDDIFANNTTLTAEGGTILTQGYSISVDSTNLSGSTTFDLGGVAGNVDLGDMSGEGEINFTNWTPETIVQIDPGSTIDPSTQVNFEGAVTQFDGSGGLSPVPEPSTYALFFGLMACAFVGVRRHRG
jgi:hypothetical protein